ncbi:MAG: hypothetical protein ACMXYF_00065 [Candidatus Woesearchaeota archaeon]
MIIQKLFSDMIREKNFVFLLILLLIVVLGIAVLISLVEYVHHPEMLLSTSPTIGFVNHIPGQIPFFVNQEFFTDEQMAHEQFMGGGIDAYVTFDQLMDGTYNVTIIVDQDDPRSQAHISLLRFYLETAEYRLQTQLTGELWPNQLRTNLDRTRGKSMTYDLVVLYMIPILLLVVSFLLGNYLIDVISDEFEKKTFAILQTAIPLHTLIRDLIIFVQLIHIPVLLLFMGILYLQFSFLQQFWLVFLFVSILGTFFFLYALFCIFYAKQKEYAQLFYNIGIFALLGASPFLSFFPLYLITQLIVGEFLLLIILGYLLCVVFAYFGLLSYLQKEYYVY